MPKGYRGTLNLDFTGADGNQQVRLALALRHAGWLHVETSALVRETTDINDLWHGIGLVAKHAASVGIVSALTFHIQSSDDFGANVSLVTTQSPANALAEIQAKPFPGG